MPYVLCGIAYNVRYAYFVQDLAVTVTGKGVETPVTCDQDLELIDFGTIFTTHTEPREIVVDSARPGSRPDFFQRRLPAKTSPDVA